MTAGTRMVKANGLDMQIVEQGAGAAAGSLPRLAGTLLFLAASDSCARGGRLSRRRARHARLWRHQRAGAIDAYTIHHLVGDIVALVAALGESKAVVIGHDWGANVAWHCAMFRPDVFPAVATLSVPLRRRGPARPLDALRQQGITTFYWQYFQEPGIVEAEFARDWNHALRAVYYGSGLSLMLKPGRGMVEDARIAEKPPAWISDDEIAHYVREFARTGLRGGINWYRNIDRNWELTAPWQDAKIHQPALFIAGSKDPVITGLIGERAVQTMEEIVPGLRRKVIIDGAGPLDPAGAA